MRLASVLIALLLLISAASPVAGDLSPTSTIQQMCFDADVIVAGRVVRPDRVQVERSFFVRPADADDQQRRRKGRERLHVPGLSEHDLALGPTLRPDHVRPVLEPDAVYLFLKSAEDGTLQPIHVAGRGSQGVVWISNGRCHRYRQTFTPGPFSLHAVSSPSRDPATEAALVREIQVGLALRFQWEAIHSIEDRRQRAQAMVAFILPTTGPKALEPYTLNLRQELTPLRADVVDPLVAALQHGVHGATLVNQVVLTLYDIGGTDPEAIRPTVPQLIRLLENPPEDASPYYLLAPIEAAADPRAIEVTRGYLDHQDGQVRAQAAQALAAMNDVPSYERISAILEASLDPQKALGETLELAEALFKLDSARAVPTIQAVEQKLGVRLRGFIRGFPHP